MSRADQVRDRDNIRRDCIFADIDDVNVTFGYSESGKSIVMTLSEPREPFESIPKFQFKLSRIALAKLRYAVDDAQKYVRKRWKK